MNERLVLKNTWCRDFALNKPVSEYHYVLQTTAMGSRFVSSSEPVYSSLNMSISLITLLGIALISKLIKRKVANPARAACGCPGAHGDIPAQVCRIPGAAYCVEVLCLPNARIPVFDCVFVLCATIL